MSDVRTRTRSDVKWLANELAATAGELGRIDAEVKRLTRRKKRLLAVHAALSRVAGQVGVPELPALVPAVNAHDKYGGRGNLRNFIRGMLKTAYPQALDTLALTAAVVERFEMTFVDAGARNHFRNSAVNHALRNLLARDEVDRLHDHKGVRNMVGVWRWRVVAPTMDELREPSARSQGSPGAALAAEGRPPRDGVPVEVAEGCELWR
jgi:hypothetical protein